MNESPVPRRDIQKEFGEVKQTGAHVGVFKYGTDEEVGAASIVRNERPFPHLTLLNVDVHKLEERGKGFASRLMEEVERMSKQSGKPVILYDVTARYHREQNPSAIGMYGRRPGWIRLTSPQGTPTDRYVYGTADPELLAKLFEAYE